MAGTAARNRTVAFCVALWAIVSCAEPSKGEIFLPAPRNSYDFALDVKDTLSTYDLSFFANFLADYSPLRLDVSWVSPSDSTYRETVYMDGGAERGTVQKYRSGLWFPEEGNWTLKVGVSPHIGGFCGLGLIWERQDGTR